MRVKMLYSPEQREGTVGAAAISSDDELRTLAKGEPLRSTLSREQGSLCWKKMPFRTRTVSEKPRLASRFKARA